MKWVLRIFEFVVTLPIFFMGFLWVQIKCSWWVGCKAGTKYGMWVNTRPGVRSDDR